MYDLPTTTCEVAPASSSSNVSVPTFSWHNQGFDERNVRRPSLPILNTQKANRISCKSLTHNTSAILSQACAELLFISVRTFSDPSSTPSCHMTYHNVNGFLGTNDSPTFITGNFRLRVFSASLRMWFKSHPDMLQRMNV